MSNKPLTEAEQHAIILADAYSEVLASKKGRLVLNDILEIATDDKCSAAISNWSTNKTFFNSGKRAVADSLKRKLSLVSPENLAKLIIKQ